MASPIQCEDGWSTFSLPQVKSEFLEEKDASDAFQSACRITQQLLFSNRLTEAHTLLLAISTFDANFSRTYRNYEPLGLNLGYLGQTAEYFFQCHDTLARPSDLALPLLLPSGPKEQWEMYNSLCSTEFMPLTDVHQEPFDPHRWRDTDDPTSIALCCLLLAKPPAPGAYPPKEKIQEALAAAQKLYAQPQANARDWDWTSGERRHFTLISRPLAVELAIRNGDLQTAADILSLAVKVDGLLNIGSNAYLKIPRIYDVLPLLEKKGGGEENPYYISKEDAAVIASELKEAMESRIEKGQQFPLGKLSWKQLLNRLASAAWEVNSKSYKQRQGLTSAKDILYPPATKEEILAAEKVVGKLPSDFKEMVKVANGFKGDWRFLDGGMAGLRGISLGPTMNDWADLLEEQGVRGDGKASGNLIRISPGAECDGYIHYLVPPKVWKKNVTEKHVETGEYCYFSWANWSGFDDTYGSVREFVVSWVEDLEQRVKDGESGL